MGKPITIGQSQALGQAIVNAINWDEVDGDLAQCLIENPRGLETTAFIKNKGKLIVSEPKVVSINRAKPFDPEKFIGKGWSFWRGPADGNGLEGEIEQDSRSLALTEIDLTKVGLKTSLKGGEQYLKGEEFLKRLHADDGIRLDAGIFQHFWENPHLFLQRFKEATNGQTTYVFFFGNTLRGPDGSRCVLYLCWFDGKLYWSYFCLVLKWFAYNPAAVLAK